jgi:hypothetical protein
MVPANRRDFAFLLTAFDPSIEYHPIRLFPDPDPVYYGHDGYRRMWGYVCSTLSRTFDSSLRNFSISETASSSRPG